MSDRLTPEQALFEDDHARREEEAQVSSEERGRMAYNEQRMSLQEWVDTLPAGHKARKELATLQQQLAVALRERDELTGRLLHSESHDCTASDDGEHQEGRTWDFLTPENRAYWIALARPARRRLTRN